MAQSTKDNSSAMEDGETIAVLHEELHVDKQIVETGAGVRVRKTASERVEMIDEALIREEAERVQFAGKSGTNTCLPERF